MNNWDIALRASALISFVVFLHLLFYGVSDWWMGAFYGGLIVPSILVGIWECIKCYLGR